MSGINHFTSNISKVFEMYSDGNVQSTILTKIKFMFVFLAFIFVGGTLLFYMSTNTSIITERSYTVFAFILFFFVIFGVFARSSKIIEFNPYHLVVGSILLIIVSIIVYTTDKLSQNSILVFNYAVYGLIALLAIVGLAIFYILFKSFLKQQTGATGLFITFLFYLPCLFTDILQWVRAELQITPSVIFLLLFIEIILGLAYLYIPKWLRRVLSNRSNVLLKGPVVLNEKLIISDEKPFLLSTKNQTLFENNNKYKTNQFSISFWVILNTLPTDSSIEQTIIRLASESNKESGRPALTFGDSKWHLYLTDNNGSTPYSFDLPHQKWHNFVIQYMDSRVDVFINGKLKHTMEWTNNIPNTIDTSYEFVAGTHNGSLDGALCSVSVTNDIISEFMITQSYNYWKYQNPPTIVSI